MLLVVLVLCLLRFFGMESYVCILFFSTIFNASLSLHRLLKVTQVRLSLMGNVAAFYIMSALVSDPGVKDMTPGRSNGYAYVQMMMTMGMFVALIFSAIFIFYINGFLMKQRKKELGLYNILGMGKGHIAALMLLEGLYVGAIGIAGGLAVGLLVLYLVITAVRQTIEPRIVGAQIGLHPVLTLMSMFVGNHLFGIVGLFGLPILLSLLRYLNDNGTISLFPASALGGPDTETSR